MIRRWLGLLLAVLFAIVGGRVAWVGYAPRNELSVAGRQVRFLDQSLADGGAERMQGLFPEGSYFLRALTASAAARTGTDLTTARGLRDGLDAADSVAVFGSGMVPEHGIFQAGWALMVAVDLAEASQTAADRDDVRRRATAIDAALRTSRTGFLAGYPQQYWPCDTVVAAGSLARAAALLDEPRWLTTLGTWRATISGSIDHRTGLLPHRVDVDGRALDGPRGSSQSIIQAFWPDVSRALDGGVDLATWARFREAFVVRKVGLVGVREFPRGSSGQGDVDSGPLIFGVSASASAVSLAAARAVGDEHLADDLVREADLLGLPLSWAGQRRYGFGVLPVGDAFLAWARSTRLAEPVGIQTAEQVLGRPLWPAFIAGWLLLAAIPITLLARTRRTRSTRTPVAGDVSQR